MRDKKAVEPAGNDAARDAVVIEGINARGFGTVPKAVMRDPDLPVEAKGIYAYLCSFAGGGRAAFPSRATMLAELGLSKDRFYKYRNMLVERGLMRVERQSAGSVARPVRTNVYILASELPECYRKRGEEISPAAGMQGGDGDRNEENAQVGEYVPETRTSKNGFPQSPAQKERPDFKDVLEARTTKRPENEDAGPAHPPTSKLENGQGSINSLISEIPHQNQTEDSHASEIRCEFDELVDPQRTVNRNALQAAFEPYRTLRESNSAAVIFAAWDTRQRQAQNLGWEAKYFPQLAKWLASPDADGAAAMCRRDKARMEKRFRAALSVKMSLNESYMTMWSEVRDLSDAVANGQASPSETARLKELEDAMASIRDAARAELLGLWPPGIEREEEVPA